jgi:hypothetical protein
MPLKISILGAAVAGPFADSPAVAWESLDTNRTAREMDIALVDAGGGGETSRLPRLRRSGRISHLAVAAALRAVRAAELGEDAGRELPVVFATTDGGVEYTGRFYSDVADGGTGSPLLFPETVYNAPASHLAAALGSARESLTLVGDSAAGLSAIETASALLAEFPRVLVVAANESDPLAAAAYSRWRIVRQPGSARGNVLADCAAALVLGLDPGWCSIVHLSAGLPWRTRRELSALLETASEDPRPDAFVALSCPRTPLEGAEADGLRKQLSRARALDPKACLGEAMAATPLAAAAACSWLLKNRPEAGTALIPAVGFLGSMSVLRLEGNRPLD